MMKIHELPALASGLIATLMLLGVPPVHAQQGREELTLEHVLGRRGPLAPRGLSALAWHPDSRRITWIQNRKGKPVLVAQELESGDAEVLLDSATLAEAWKKSGLKGRAPRISSSLRWSAADESLRWLRGRSLLRIDLDPVHIQRVLELPAGVGPLAFAPADRQVAFVKDYNIQVLKRDGSTVAVTRNGYVDLTHGVAVSRSEFGIHDGLWWDPSGRRLAFYREDLTPIAPYPYVDFSKTPARAVHGRYPMAGRAGSVVSVGVYDSRDDSVIWLKTDPRRDEYLTNVTWGPGGERIYIAHVNREQNLMELKVYRASDGEALGTLFSEADEQWVEPESGPIFPPGRADRFLWFSPRDGFRHLYLYKSDGTLVRQLTRGAFDFSAVLGWDEGGAGFLAQSSGPDPRQEQVYHVTLGGEQRRITSGGGVHNALVAPDGRHLIDRHSDLSHPPVSDVVRCADGKVLRRLYSASNPLANFRLGTVRALEMKSADGQPMYGLLIVPPAFDPARKYPLIQYVYGGPHSQLVKDRWMGGLGRWNLWLQYMATRGFVVLIADNRGTSKRGIEWEQAIHRHLGAAEVADQVCARDHVLGLGFIDPQRVGVHGWSFGGFMTLSLMTRAGEKYRAGVAGAPVTDWAYYETGYGERYMDMPKENPKGYREAQPGAHLKGLRGRLLVVQGSSDKTVMWQNSIAFASRCVAAGKQVEMMVYPGQLHGLSGRSFEHFLRKMTAFFVEELLESPDLLRATAVLEPRVERVAGGFRFTEGPAWSPAGYLLFSDVPAEKIQRVDAKGKLEEYLSASGGANGLAFDASGNLYVCESKSRRVVCIDVHGRKRVLAESWKGKRLNSPNDLALDDHGGLYFTDPRYGSQDGREMEVMGVYYISAGGEVRRVIDDLVRPNGVLVAADGKSLYVADADRSLVLRYPIRAPGEIGAATKLFSADPDTDGQGPDGMALDLDGNLYLTFAAVLVIRPDGRLVGRISVPERPSNCTFGGPQGRSLFITARSGLYRVPMLVQGLPPRGGGW